MRDLPVYANSIYIVLYLTLGSMVYPAAEQVGRASGSLGRQCGVILRLNCDGLNIYYTEINRYSEQVEQVNNNLPE
jgi:hypothetical protein